MNILPRSETSEKSKRRISICSFPAFASIFLDHLDLQIIKFNMFNEIILIKPCFAVLLKIPDSGVKPDGIAKIQLIADLLQAVKNLVCPGLLAVITDYSVF